MYSESKEERNSNVDTNFLYNTYETSFHNTPNKENNTHTATFKSSNKAQPLVSTLWSKLMTDIDEFKWLNDCKADPDVMNYKCIEQIISYIDRIAGLEISLREKINQCLGMENKLADKENVISMYENRIKALEDKFKIQSKDESQTRSQKLHLEATIVKMASKMKDMEIVNHMQVDLKHKHHDRTEENRMMNKEIELLRMKNKSLNEQLSQITSQYYD